MPTISIKLNKQLSSLCTDKKPEAVNGESKIDPPAE